MQVDKGVKLVRDAGRSALSRLSTEANISYTTREQSFMSKLQSAFNDADIGLQTKGLSTRANLAAAIAGLLDEVHNSNSDVVTRALARAVSIQ